MQTGNSLICLVVVLGVARAFPDGPPLTACTTMRPGIQVGVVGYEGHLTVSQNILPTYGNSRQSNYRIDIHSANNHYLPGEEISVSVIADQTTGMRMYKGLLMQARRVICVVTDSGQVEVEDQPLGEFVIPYQSDSLLKTLDCQRITASAVCHRSPQFKINETVTWRSPTTDQGAIVFKATVVQQANIFWTNVHSPVLMDSSLAPPVECSACRAHVTWTLLAAILLPVVHLLS